eukprot:m.207099 g.207099  ORF g.207099 m.207099 type:complete len:286 (-) comp15539_c0_seq5:20-877(-)
MGCFYSRAAYGNVSGAAAAAPLRAASSQAPYQVPMANAPIDHVEAFARKLAAIPNKPRIFRVNSGQSYDPKTYQNNYPGQHLDNRALTANVRFYRNQLKCQPDNFTIEELHAKWWGNYNILERAHGYIQWLFPIHEPGVNPQAQVLQRHEAEVFRTDPAIRTRVVRSYELMLDFYGFRLDAASGALTPTPAHAERFRNLVSHPHNNLRITRILKALGEYGLEHYKAPLVVGLLHEIVVTGALRGLADSCINYWVPTLRDEQARRALLEALAPFTNTKKRSSAWWR